MGEIMDRITALVLGLVISAASVLIFTGDISLIKFLEIVLVAFLFVVGVLIIMFAVFGP